MMKYRLDKEVQNGTAVLDTATDNDTAWGRFYSFENAYICGVSLVRYWTASLSTFTSMPMVKKKHKEQIIDKLEEPVYFHPERKEDLPVFTGSESNFSRMLCKPQQIELEKGDQLPMNIGGHNAILFCMEGCCTVSDICRSYASFSVGYMMMLPFGSILTLKAVKPSILIVIHFAPGIVLCQGICPKHFKRASSRKVQVLRLNDSTVTHSLLPPSYLSINDAVKVWLDSLFIYASKLSDRSDVFDIKLRELFFLYRLTYESEDLDMFLRYFHCRNTGFRSFVFNHHLQCRTVEDLASLMGISTTSLKRFFQEEFGTSPLKWMNERKAQFIQRDLIETDLTMIEMAERYNLGSASYFCSFTKRMLGDTPQIIRQKARKRQEIEG